MPLLKKEILLLNTEDTNFMTLGCWLDKSPDYDDVLDAYIEFCFRPEVDTSNVDLLNLDTCFYDYVEGRVDKEARETIESRLDWVYHHTKIYNAEPSVMVFHVIVEAYTPEFVESFFVPIVSWLRKYYKLPSP